MELLQSDYHVSILEDLLLEADEPVSSLGNLDDFDEWAKLCTVDPSDFEDFNLTSKQEATRFGPPTSDKDLRDLTTSTTPANTSRNTQWGVQVYESWRKSPSNQHRNIPALLAATKDELAYHLPRFVNEARRQNGALYPPKSLYQMACYIQRFLRSERPEFSNLCLVDIKNPDPVFRQFVLALDAKIKTLTREGVGTTRKQADTLTLEDEAHMWRRGLFSAKNATILVRTVFLLCRKVVCIEIGRARASYVLPSDIRSRFWRKVSFSVMEFLCSVIETPSFCERLSADELPWILLVVAQFIVKNSEYLYGYWYQ